MQDSPRKTSVSAAARPPKAPSCGEGRGFVPPHPTVFPVPLCPCARGHTPRPLLDACPSCTLRPDRSRRAPAAAGASRSPQGVEELIRLEAADKRTHGLKRPRPIAQATPTPRPGQVRALSRSHAVPLPEAPQPASNYLKQSAQGTVGGQAPTDNCPGPEGFPAPSPQLLITLWEGLQGRSPGGWLYSGVGFVSLPVRGGEWHRLWYV